MTGKGDTSTLADQNCSRKTAYRGNQPRRNQCRRRCYIVYRCQRCALRGFIASSCAVLEGDPYRLENLTIGAPSVARDGGPDQPTPVGGVAVDAKQRFVWAPTVTVRTTTVNDSADGQYVLRPDSEVRTILCAEPSPDALTAVSNTIDTELRRKTVLNSEATSELVAGLAGSLSETAQTIGNRTQVVQLLRDALYRACEAYANGALDEFGYALILGQIDVFMLQLLSADILGRAQGRGQVVEATKLRDDKLADVEALRSSLAAAQQEAARLDAKTREAEERADATARLGARKKELEARRSARKADENRLEGSQDKPGSVSHSRAQLAAIEDAETNAVKKNVEFRTKQAEAEALPDGTDAKAKKELEVRKAEIEAEAAQRDADIATANEEHFEETLQGDLAELARVRSDLVDLEAEIAAIESLIDTQQTAAAPVMPTPAEYKAVGNQVAELRTQLVEAEKLLAQHEAALAQASEGVGPGPAEVMALENLFTLSFKSTEGKGPPTRVVQSACLQWLARNPQVTASKTEFRQGEIVLQLAGGGNVPAIAAYCHNILHWKPSDEGPSDADVATVEN